MYKILDLKAREILDSRGNPTVEVEVLVSNGEKGTGYAREQVPSGASTGVHEALELRDGDEKRFLGKGVLRAVENVNKIIKDEVLNKEFESFREFDKFLIDLDGTKNKSRLGANAILGVSMAFVRAAANSEGRYLFDYLSDGLGVVMPIPMMNVINGGKHADNDLDIQEFMIVPVGAKSIHEAIRMGSETFHNLKNILKSRNLFTGVGDEGGFAPNLKSVDEAFEILLEAIDKAGYSGKIKLAIDAAASEFYDKEQGIYDMKGLGKKFTAEELTDFYADLVKKYPIISIEDPMDEDDFSGWAVFMKKLGNKIMVVGDDIIVTNIERIKMAMDKNLCNSALIKLNQIGTVSETLDAIALAHENDRRTVISHRSGETESTFIADLAVAVNSGFIKTGSMSRGERIAKYNQLLRIEERLGKLARYGE